MRRWSWLPAAVMFTAACGGKTVDVLEKAEAPGTGGSSSSVPVGSACWAPEDCGAGQICHPDGVCHPSPAACGAEACVPGSGGACECQWECTDQSEYETRCRLTDAGLITCNCLIDGEEFPWTCVVEEPTTDTCWMGKACCAFPSSTPAPWTQ